MREDFSMARNVSVTPVQSLSAGEIFRKSFSERGNDISSNVDDRCEAGHQKHTSLVIEPSNRVERYCPGKHIDTRWQETISRSGNINTEYYVSFDCKRA